MKIKTYSLAAVVSLFGLWGCSTLHQTAKTETGAETVMVTYHVQTGKEAEFQLLLSHGWDVYRNEHLVFAKPHTIVKQPDGEGKTRFVEIFTWVKSPDHAPDSVKVVWQQEQSLCEARNENTGIEGGEVTLIAK